MFNAIITLVTLFANGYSNLIESFAAAMPWLAGPTYVLTGSVNPRTTWVVWVVCLPLLVALVVLVRRINKGNAAVVECGVAMTALLHFMVVVALCGADLI